MFSEFLLHDTLVITSLAVLVLMAVLPFILWDDGREA
jgi:hypothetical protein